MSRAVVDVEMLDVFTAELKLCKVKVGEVVAVLSGGNDHPEYAQTFMLAAQNWCHHVPCERAEIRPA